MPEVCSQCGAALKEGNAFCTKCGARRNASTGSVDARSFCTKCGAPLGEAKFCTKCGAPAEIPAGVPPVPVTPAASAPVIPPSTAQTSKDTGAQGLKAVPVSATPAVPPQKAASAVPVAKSPGIPKTAIVVIGIIVVFIVAVVAGVTYVVHRAKQKSAQLEAQSEIEKSLVGLTAAANAAQNANNPAAAQELTKKLADLAAAAQNANNPAAAEELKKNLADLAAAAQDPKTQAAVQDLTNKLGALAAGASGSGQNPNSPASAEDIRKDLPAAGKPAQNGTNQAAVQDLTKRLSDLLKAAPDQKTWVAVNDLRNKLDQLDIAVRRNPNNPMAMEDLNKGLGDITAAASNLTPAISAATDAALTPPPVPSGPPMTPVAGTGDPKHDWPLEYERTVGGPEADLVVRTGDINNLGFGWPSNFDPFSGKSTPPHPWPNILEIPPQAPPGTDRIMLGTGVTPVHMSIQHTAGKLDRVMIDSVTSTTPGDGYSGALQSCYAIRDSVGFLHSQTTDHIQLPRGYDDSALSVSTQWAVQCTRDRQLTMPTPIVLPVGELPAKINAVLVQIFADDFQPIPMHSHFQVGLNGTRIPTFEDAFNALDQSGPIGKLLTLKLLPEYWPLLKSGTVKLLIDDPTTHAQDGYAVDFVRILVNPHQLKYQVSLSATVTDADKHTPIAGANVTAALESAPTDHAGKCELKGIPAGLVVATASAPGYDDGSVTVDLPAGQAGRADIQLHAHQESIAALEKSIAQTGTATIYGIHFDTGSSKLRPDSTPALEAVLGLINGHAGSNWIIAGHTDNQGSDALNIPLSKARAASVISWLTGHGVAANRLEPQGFGATRPVADNATANGRALNRRVEVALAK